MTNDFKIINIILKKYFLFLYKKNIIRQKFSYFMEFFLPMFCEALREKLISYELF